MTSCKSGAGLKSHILLHVLLACIVLLGALPGWQASANPAVDIKLVETLVEEMTPEEKVGQLFLVTFNGTNIGKTRDIYDLIVNHHIGGVILSADLNNFTDVDTVTSAYQLIAGLQQLAWEKSSLAEASEASDYQYVPLFIGIEQEGNGAPNDQILNGLTSLPSQMSIGATWDASLAREVGQVMGSELAALGINFYLGPSLDVVDAAVAENAYYSGTSTFGGDPYWVGELGKAYIAGLHSGSAGRLAVISKHFPGQGSTDRSPEDEVATVRKSLEQLKQIELAPFFAVTNSTTAPEAQTDGLMISHIRYQGFQGNIRATTRPVSFDSTALSQLMALDTFSTWYADGGLIVSDNLGSRAVRRFFDPAGEIFDAPQVARSAFQAGNDLLYLKDFIATNSLDTYSTILDTLDLFVQKYQEDMLFAQRVDASVQRIITSKLSIYGEFNLDTVIPDPAGLVDTGNGQMISLRVLREAVTLISPDQSDLDTILAEEPSAYDYMVIFTDARTEHQCAMCEATSMLSARSLQTSLLSLYGPTGSNQLQQSRLSSYSFSQLLEVLDNRTELSDPNLVDNLGRADWVIFNILDFSPNAYGSNALKRILSERPDLLRNKIVIVFAYDTPFYLDATEISKVTAYYGLFSKIPEAVDVAARVLMREMKPEGDLPVSVKSMGYDLITITAPDPNQIIELNLIKPDTVGEELTTPETTTTVEAPLLAIGENVQIETSIIRDKNGNPVPDGTVVRFTFRSVEDNMITQQVEAVTVSGKARLTYRIEWGGTMEVTAVSEPATISSQLLLNIERGIAEIIMPTPTPQPTPTSTPVPTATPTLAPTVVVTEAPVSSGFPSLGDWFTAFLMVLASAGVTYLLGYFWWGSTRWGLRSALCTALGGLAAYLVLNLGFEGTQTWLAQEGRGFVLQVVMIGLFLGWIAALAWWMVADRNKYTQLKE